MAEDSHEEQLRSFQPQTREITRPGPTRNAQLERPRALSRMVNSPDGAAHSRKRILGFPNHSDVGMLELMFEASKLYVCGRWKVESFLLRSWFKPWLSFSPYWQVQVHLSHSTSYSRHFCFQPHSRSGVRFDGDTWPAPSSASISCSACWWATPPTPWSPNC